MSNSMQLGLFMVSMWASGIGFLCWISKKERGTWRFWK